MEDYYALLGLRPTASAEEIKAAHRHLVVAFHRRRALKLARDMDRIEQAFAVLGDPGRKRSYDARYAEHRAELVGSGSRATVERDRRMGKLVDAERRRMARLVGPAGRAAAQGHAPWLRALGRERDQQRRRAGALQHRRRARQLLDVAMLVLLALAVVLGAAFLRCTR